MSLKSTSALEDFTNSRKYENIITGIGIDLTHNFLKISFSILIKKQF